MASIDEIRKILMKLDGSSADDLESETLELKAWPSDHRSLHRMLRETVVCLANTRGGTLIVGVRDGVRTRREAIEGIGHCDLAALRRSIYDGTEPHILVEIEQLVEPEGTLLLIHIPKGMPPHTTSDGVARIRIGKECKPLTGKTFAQLMAAGGQRDPTAEVMQDVSADDLDSAEMESLRKIFQQETRNPELATMTTHQLLGSLGLMDGDKLTVAGILVLGKQEVLMRHVPQHEIIFLRYPTRTRYDQRKDLRGPLLSVLREMERLVSVNNRIRTIQDKGFGQLELPDLSWEVAREGMLNAVTHRDYFLRQGVQVALYRDRLEIISPGGFIGGITPDNVLRHPPQHRNELLARTFQALGFVNRVGLGVDRIYESLLLLGKGLPRYSADESHVQLTIPLKTSTGFALFVSREKRRGKKLDLDDLMILDALTRTSSLDRWSAARILQVTEEEAAERLVRLREVGYLIVRGRGRGSAYDLRRDLAIELRGQAAVDAILPLEEEAIKLRILALLRERGRLTNSEIRRFSGFSRTQVYRLVKELESKGQVRFAGSGRGAHILPVK